MQTTMALFVYGSLTEGMVHFEKLKPYVTQNEHAVVRGFAYRMPVGYPAFMSRNLNGNTVGAQAVEGNFLTLEAPDLFYRILDEFYGYSAMTPDKSLHWKEKAVAQIISGERSGQDQEAMVYVMNPSKLPKDSELLSDGDWRRALVERPALTQELTDRQSTYIKRLFTSTGREIVPIDLNLYRELLKLDLIVDKGRRLALTKLGKEVARYLS